MRNLFIALGMSALTFSGLAQNNCNSAVSLDPVPADAACPGTPNGSFTTPVPVTLGDVAGPSNPYTYVPDCDNTPGNDMELFANDLWFSFTATANILNVDLTNIVGLSEANVGFYTGTCAQLIGLGCSISGANPSSFSATLEPLTPGDTYYIQVSGGALDPTTGSFDIAIANSLDCNDCLTGATLTVNPAPIAGTYQPGQVVDFCFTVTDYTQVSANWFHGVEIQLGSGWDQTIGTNGIVATATPASCSGSGVWGLYSSVSGVNGTYGPGFYYDYNGFPNGPGDGNPGNNFGDNNAALCDPQFCWQLTVSNPAICNPASPPSLDVSVNTLADGESGSWTSLACTDDPLYTVNAIISCCNPPNMASTPVSCPGVSDGSVTATIPGSEPTIDGVYYFSFYDEFGALVYSTSVDNTGNAGNDVSVTTPSTLSEGDYTVVVSNPVNCAATAIETVAPPAGAVTATVPADVFVCTGNNVGPLVFGVTPATPGYDFDWTMDTDIGAGTSGTGVTQIDAFNASNTGSSIIVSTVTVTPTPIAAGCPGVPETFTITVNPAPIITLTASPGTTVCAGEPVDLEACYTPAPLGVSTSFLEGTDVQIEWTGSGNGPETGTMSVTSTGIEPTTLQPGTLESICFTLSMQDPADIDYFTIEVNGVVYSSSNTEPAGSVYNADLNTIYNTINSTPDNGNGQAPPVTVTYCMPQTFLDLIDATGGAANTTWTFFTEFSLSGSNDAFIWDFEVVMLDVTPYTYNWSPTGTITAGSTSGDSFGECHTVTISTPVDETYTFDILDNTGCTGTATVDITVTTGPTATITDGSASYCEEDAASTGIDIDVDLTGIPDWSITYDTDGDLGTTGDQVTVNSISTSPYTITNVTAGTYQLVSVTDQGCPGGVVSGTYTVTENPTPTATIGSDATVCQNDPSPTITFTGATGTAPYTFTYNINGGGDVTVVSDGTGVATVSAPTGTVGSFTYNLVSVEDANLCSQTQTGSATVVVNPIPTATIDTDVTVCQNDASPTITFTGSNGTAPYTFTYNINGGGDQTAVSDGTGVATISAPTGSAGTFTYNLTAVSDASATACSATLTDAAVVTVNPIPTATIGADATVCQNDPSPTITFTGANGSAPYTFTYNINGGGDVTVVSDGTGVATVSAPTGTAGTFTYNLVSVSDDNLCSQAQAGTATVIVNPTPTATIDTDVTVCQNDASPTITFTGSNGTAPYTFTYNINGGGDQTAVSDGTGVATISAPTGSAGTFTYNLTAVSDASATACSATLTDAAVVTVNPLPTATIGADATVCQNDPSPTITFTGANGTAPYTFTYNINGGGDVTVVSDGTGVATVSAPTGTAGTFTYNLVSVSDNNLCSQAQAGTATVIVNPTPTATIDTDVTVCQNDASPTITFTGSNGTAPYTFTYNINGGGDQTAVSDGTGVATISAPTGSAGTFTYNLTAVSDASATACSATLTDAAVVTVNPLPTATIGTDVTVCVGDASPDITFTGATGTAPYTFTYNIDGGADQTVVSDGTGVATVSAPTGTGGTFTYNLVSVSDANGCSQPQTGSAVVTVDVAPTGTVTSGSAEYCAEDAGATGISIQIDFTGSPNWSWVLDTDGDLGTTGDQLATSGSGNPVTINNAIAGTYQLVSVSDQTACPGVVSGVFTITENPTPTATIGTDVSVCVGDASPDVTLTGATGTAPYTFTYNINGGADQTVVSDGTGVATVSAPTGTGGTFTYNLVSVSDANGCSQTQTGAAVVTVNAVPVLTLQDTTGCSPFTVDLSDATYWSTDVGTMTWYSDAGLTTPLGSTTVGAGTYYVEADNAGCTASGSVVVTETITPTLTVQDSTGCFPFLVNLTDPTYWSTDVGVISYYTDAGLTTTIPDPTLVGAGTYYIAADNAGCVSSAPVTLTENASPVIAASGVDPSVCNGTDGSIEVTLSSGTIPTGTLDWTGTASGSNPAADITADSPDITGLAAGSYDVTFTDDNGCVSNTLSVGLNNPGAPVIDPILAVVSCADYTLDLSSVTGTDLNQTGNLSYYSATGGPSGTGVVIPDGTTFTAFTDTTIFVYDENGSCSAEVQYNVTINTTPTLTLQDTTTCSPNTVDLADATYWSTDVGTMTWYSDAGLSSILPSTVVGDGTYYVEADNFGCTSNGQVTVTVNTTPTLTVQDTTTCSPNTVDLTDVTYWSTDVGTISFFESDGTTPVADATTVGAGTYVLEADNLGCISTANVTVTVNTTPTLTVQDTTTCSPNTVDLTDVTYWSTDVGTISFFESDGTTPVADATTLGAGTYVLEADNLGCISTANVTVTVNTTPTLTVQDTTTCSPNTIDLTDVTYWSTDVGTISFFESDGTTPVADATTVGAGTYVLEADNLGCITTANVTVTVNTTPTLTVQDTTTCSPSTVDLTDVTYWSTDVGTISFFESDGTTPVADATTVGAGTYVLEADNLGCISTANVTVTVNTTPTLTVQDTTTCSPNTIDLTDVTYWSTDVGTISFFESDGTTPVADATTVGAGTYVLEADNSGCITTANVTVTVNTTPTLTVQDTTTCSPNTVDLTDVTYWSTDVGTISFFESDGTTPVADATTVGAGTYVLEADNLGCISTANVTVTVNTTPTLTVQDTTTCSPNTVDLTDVTYWSTDVGTISFFESDGTTPVADATTVGAGTYVLEADNSGCITTANVTVTVNTTPTLTVQDTTVCPGSLIDLTDNTFWTTDVGTLSYYTDAGLTIPVADPTNVGLGTYYVAADNLGCVASAPVVVSEFTSPVIAGVGTDPSVCNGTDGSIEVTLSAGITSVGTLDWTGTASGSNGSADVTADSPDITSLAAGTYDITFTDANGCVSNTVNVVLNNPGAPILDPITAVVSCLDYTLDITSVTGTNLVNPQYYSETGGPAGTGVVIPDGTVFTAFTDTTIFVYDVNGTCSAEIQYNVTINTTPTLTLQDTTTCSPNTVDLADATYWSTDVGTMTWYSDAGLTTALGSTVVGAGTYYVEADNLGCTSNGQAIVTVNTTPTLTVQDTTTCSPNTIDLTDVTYWSTDVGTISFFESDGTTPVADATTVGAGTYVLEADNLGCISTANVIVTVNTTPTLTLQDTTTCSPNTVDLADVTYWSTDVGTMTWYSDAGLTTALGSTNVGAGTYYVEADNLGCTSNGQVTVTVNTTPTLTVQDTTGCSPFTVDLTDATYWSTDVGTISYFESDGTTPVANATTVGAGTYVLEANNLGCISTANVVVTEVTTPDVDPLGPIAECDSYTLPVITGTALSGTEAYYTGMGGTGTAFNAGDAITTTGLTTLYIYDGASGCSDEEQLDITITATPLLTVADPTAVCEPNLVDITGSATSDVGTITFYTDAGLTTPVVDPTQVTAGQYFVEADNNGCTANNLINVIINPVPLAPTAGTDSTYCTSWVLDPMTATGGAGTMTWYDAQNNVLGTGSTYTPDMTVGVTDYYVTETLAGCEGPASLVTITIEECDITIPTAITPNGDLNNDSWEIVNLDAVYPDNVVQIYNRWGNLIFEHVSSPSDPYSQNQWDGTYEGNALPVGSYFYVIRLNDEEVATGAVSIILD